MASSFDILNMDPDQFAAALDELGLPAEQRSLLERQYFEQNRALPMTSRPEGRTVGTILPFSRPEGMTGAEALMAGELDFAVPEMIRGLYEAPAEALNVGRAMVRGAPVTQQQLLDTAMTVGSAGLGPRPMPRGAPKVAAEVVPETVEEGFIPAEPDYWEGVQPDADFVNVEDIDWDEDMVDAMNEGMLRNAGYLPKLPSYEVRPATVRQEGLAGLYSPTRNAVDLLDRPAYDNLDSLRVQLLNRGAKPEELERVIARAWDEMDEGPLAKDRLASLADAAGQDLKVSTRTRANSPQDNPIYMDESYFLRGADDIGANVFEVETDVNRVPDQAFSHFSASGQDRAPILHTRFGMMRSPGSDVADTYHLGELQSDWAQTRSKLPVDEEALNKVISERAQLDDELSGALSALRARQAELGRGDSFILDEADDPVEQRLLDQIDSVHSRRDVLGDKLRLSRAYGFRGDFDAKYPAPYVGTTSKWVQLGLRQSLLDAVNRGAKRMTVSTGEQVQGYTGGSLEGQQKFYDGTVPKELDAVLKKFAKEAGIGKPEITQTVVEGNKGQRYTVPTVEFTDEFIDALKRVGMPTYAQGGIVSGSYLDNDPFDPGLR